MCGREAVFWEPHTLVRKERFPGPAPMVEGKYSLKKGPCFMIGEKKAALPSRDRNVTELAI